MSPLSRKRCCQLLDVVEPEGWSRSGGLRHESCRATHVSSLAHTSKRPTLQFHTKKIDLSALPFHPTTICSTNKPLTPRLDETWQTEAEQQAARAERAAADSATVAVAAIAGVDVVADVDAAVARRATRRSGSL